MAEPGQIKQSSGGVIIAGVFCVIALGVFLFTKSFDPESRWADYYRAYHNAGAAALVAGSFWLVFALLKAKTEFFDVNRKMDSDELSITITALVIAVVVVFYLVFSNLPSLVPAPDVQVDPAERARLAGMDKMLKILVGAAISITSLLVASFPFRRYLRR